MKPVGFPQANKTLLPSGAAYSANVGDVGILPTWSDGEQCVSRWKLTLRERLQVLLYGHVWVAVLSGDTQPPICIDASKEYFTTADAAPVEAS